MNKKRFHAFLATLGAIAVLTISGGLRAQDALKGQSQPALANAGAEYQYLFQILGMIGNSLQADKDREATITRMQTFPRSLDAKVEEMALKDRDEAVEKDATAQKRLSRLESGRSHSFLSWFFSKDFTWNLPAFAGSLKPTLREESATITARKLKVAEEESIVDKVDDPQFLFLVGMTQYLDGALLKDKDGGEAAEEFKDLDALKKLFSNVSSRIENSTKE